MKLKCPYCMKDTRTDRLIINLCHALRHNVKFFRSSMTLQSISGRETVSHAQQTALYLCIRTVQTIAIAGLLSGQESFTALSPSYFFFLDATPPLIMTSCWIRSSDVSNLYGAGNECSRIHLLCMWRPRNVLCLVWVFVQWVCKMMGSSRDLRGFRAVLI